jgi:hypothetical protein
MHSRVVFFRKVLGAILLVGKVIPLARGIGQAQGTLNQSEFRARAVAHIL